MRKREEIPGIFRATMRLMLHHYKNNPHIGI
jgi:hypothetical protein